ncbi:hypothetical protein B1C78_09390 [Thioalkalivibrio denitrificans]|uniref:Chromate resistance protein n=1 Tax=Thioalkalivibrio denitrificans TaxID=108003 RepID=A0A1V3NGF3_9GAMM|nr:chromate resistance protein ChrB domain-containing protein [Thioalkalivibrio denitrificans]OOG24130.1 hypothetical protein B1C78_09390 [Thioalkalivibrio denitrificans]
MTSVPPRWQMLILSFPGGRNTSRVRLWRALKALGAGTLRDGVYVLPERADLHEALGGLAEDIRAAGGQAHHLVFAVPSDEDDRYKKLFDRTEEYRAVTEAATALCGRIDDLPEPELLKQLRQIRRDADHLHRIDYFPGPERDAMSEQLAALEGAVQGRLSPDEPSQAPEQAIARLNVREYRNRTWATRASLWVDRVASAWLIRRFIDPEARFLWLARPADCPADALGFDFDGAAFTHVGDRVTFQVLTAAFSLEDDPGLVRLGELVRFLDIGGAPIAEAAGFEAVLTGAKQRCPDDDALLDAASPVLDDMHRSFSPTQERNP